MYRTDDLVEVSGIVLRYAILAVMQDVTRPTGVGEIARSIERLGVRAPDRAGKWVSDALRTEVHKGRIVQIGRDRYVAGEPVSKRTGSRIRRTIGEARRRGEGNKGRW